MIPSTAQAFDLGNGKRAQSELTTIYSHRWDELDYQPMKDKAIRTMDRTICRRHTSGGNVGNGGRSLRPL